MLPPSQFIINEIRDKLHKLFSLQNTYKITVRNY